MAFAGCTSLNVIAVNTDKEEEIAQIKESLPHHLRDFVITRALWDEALHERNLAYTTIINEPRVSGLFGIHEKLGLVSDVLTRITFFEGQDNLALQQLQSEIRALPIPTSQDGLESYRKDVHALAQQVKNDFIAQADVTPAPEKMLADRLRDYVDYLQTSMAQKEERRPGFFESNPELRKIIRDQFDAVIRLKNYLDGDDSVLFSEEDKTIFNEKDF